MVPTLTYLANTIKVGDRQIPYSVVTAIDLHELDSTFSSIAECHAFTLRVTKPTSAPLTPQEHQLVFAALPKLHERGILQVF